MLQLNVATLPKVVPDDVFTCPSVGADRRPQSVLTVQIQGHVCFGKVRIMMDSFCVVAPLVAKQLSNAKKDMKFVRDYIICCYMFVWSPVNVSFVISLVFVISYCVLSLVLSFVISLVFVISYCVCH